MPPSTMVMSRLRINPNKRNTTTTSSVASAIPVIGTSTLANSVPMTNAAPKPARRPSPRQTPLSRIRLSLTGKPEATISLADTICPAENGMGSRTGRSSAV